MSRQAGLLAMLLVLALGSGAVAQEPSPTPERQRFEFAEEGVAIELPAEWEALPYGGPGHEAVIAAYQSTLGGTCAVAKWPSFGLGTVNDILENVVPTGYWTGLPGGYDVARVSTAAGDAVRVTYTEVRSDLAAAFWNAMYFLPAGHDLYTVQCNVEYDTPTPPEDDWLSIAETFEFLPAGE
jgi:hypothetical protein